MLTGWFGTAEAGSRASAEDGGNRSDPDDDTQIMEPDQGNVLSHIISQLRPGADLSRVVLPTFILEPRSMLERITKFVSRCRTPASFSHRLTASRSFMCHPEMLLHIPTIDDDVERFVSVVKFYLSGWHIKPPGVKKPLNPILGEIFSCYWDLPDNKKAYYISEQTSHHPPKSSYFYMAPDSHIRIDGTLRPRSKFLGNSAASMMEGIAFLSLLNRGKDKNKGERYIITQPNMYARGILFGKMKYELGDHSFVRCPELDLTADLDFKTKGWVSGTYNAVGGVIKRESTGEVLYEISGMWHEEMFLKDMTTGHKEMFFDATHAKPSNPQARPIPEQEERESQRLWESTARAVKERNHELATDEKTKIEDRQREEAAARTQEGKDWQPATGEEGLEWIIDAHIDSSASPEEQTKQILAIYPVLPGQKAGEVTAVPSNDAAPPPAAAAAKPTAENDLIDFASNDAPAQAPVKPANDVENMLKETGKPAEGGSLIDL
ncbi:hypothetical protein NLG97_g8296 [Lecanicillium saksenae]|uniref:Uncharacterized protein n=1 Tax=Lecanicillium saksenae TaxID=468837 RepID=A0ACC1QJA9_9HYPO|nr:hypothetical protein NLG97_g8296 [Lecanicillium saksenae]